MTSPIERFWPKPDMDVAPDGPFVRYSDYERLSAELAWARAAAIEECAKVADRRAAMANQVSHEAARALLQALPDAIRAIMEKEPQG